MAEDNRNVDGPLRDASALNNQAAGLIERYQRTGELGLLDRAIELLRKSHLIASHREITPPPTFATNLASVLLGRFQETGDRRDVNEAISLLRQLALTGVTLHQTSMLVRALLDRYRLDRDRSDLDRAIDICRYMLDNGPAQDPARGLLLHLLGQSLEHRFELTESFADLDGAIEAHRAAAGLLPANQDRSRLMAALGALLKRRYELRGDTAALDEAIRVTREAMAQLDQHDPVRGEVLNLAGVVLRYQYEHTGEPAALSESVGLLRRSVEETGGHDRALARHRSSLAAALLRQFENTGDADLIDEAIGCLRRIVAETPAGSTELGGWLNNLAAALRERYTHFGDLGALLESIDLLRQAVTVTPADNAAHITYVWTHGIALQDLFDRTGDAQTAEEAVAAAREVLPRTVGNERANALSTLANALPQRSRATGDAADLRDAVALLDEAVRLTPFGDSGHARYLNNLSNVWMEEFKRAGDFAALDQAIVHLGRAARADPVPVPLRAQYQRRFGELLLIQYDRTQDRGALRAAAYAFAEAAANASARPLTRVLAADSQSAAAAAEDRWNEALAAAELSVELIPQVATRRLVRPDQEYGLARLSSVAADAAACALRVEDVTRAVRLLEQGRGVLLSQVLETHGDLSALREQHPELAQRLAYLNDQQDALDAVTASADPAGDRRHALVRQRDELVTYIRTLPRFAGFFAPPSLEELLACAADGPVVLVNVSRHGGDALVLRPDGVIRVSLPNLTPQAAAEQSSRFADALAATREPGPGEVAAQNTGPSGMREPSRGKRPRRQNCSSWPCSRPPASGHWVAPAGNPQP